MKIAVAGIGYVGLSNAILLAQHHEVVALDVIKDKVNKLNEGIVPIAEEHMQNFLNHTELNLCATLDPEEAFVGAKVIFISTPTNYCEENNSFDTSSIEDTLDRVIEYNPEAIVVIKSTIPIGYTKSIRERYNKENIIFSPEFLREGKALYDNQHPSRIIVGDKTEEAKLVAHLLKEGSLEDDVPVLLVSSKEAEAIKLFANTYLAMRVAYFNELDSYAEANGLSAAEIVRGISLDPRIGDFYNNPSFGYGGYCLPKDTKQLLFNYKGTPNQLIEAIVKSNQTRKEFVASKILEKKPKVVGIYRLVMKKGSDNFRSSAIWDVMKLLEKDVKIMVYEPTVDGAEFEGYALENDFHTFVANADIIIANRLENELMDYKDKVYTRDLFSRD